MGKVVHDDGSTIYDGNAETGDDEQHEDGERPPSRLRTSIGLAAISAVSRRRRSPRCTALGLLASGGS